MTTSAVRRRLSRALAALVAAGALYVAGVELLLPREDRIPAEVDAVMVLSSGFSPNGRLDPEGAGRFQRGAEVARSRALPLYVSRVRMRKSPYFTSDSGQRLIADSIGLSRWTILDGVATNTRDEAERLRRTLQSNRIIVVTTRLHTRRACATFESLGFRVTCISSGREFPLWKAPYFVAYESAALVKYRLKGWI